MGGGRLTTATAAKTIDALFVILDRAVIEETAVLQSQVVDQMLALQRAGIRSALLATTRDATRFDAIVGDRLRAAGVECVLVPHRGLVRNTLALATALRTLSQRVQIRAAYARTIWAPIVMWIAHPICALRYVYDVRGTIADETLVAGSTGARVKAATYGALERWCLRRAWRVTTVSHPFADELLRRTGRNVVVIPSCIDIIDMSAADRDAHSVRRELGFSADDCVLVYSGGMDRYQAIPQMLDLWRRLAAAPNIRFLMLVKSAPQSAANDDDPLSAIPGLAATVVRRSLPRADVPRYLAACDAGFIVRESRLTNRVASPVKFAEYTAAGLAVVASPGVGDMSSLVIDEQIGVLVDADTERSVATVRAFLADLHRDRDAIRTRARALAAARYDWAAYASVHRSLYEVSGTEAGD